MLSGRVIDFKPPPHPPKKAQLDERMLTGAILCVFIVDVALHLFEMIYKSVTELRTAQTR